MTSAGIEVQSVLRGLVASFEHDRRTVTKAFRTLLERDPDLLSASALRLLAEEEFGPGHAFLLAMLLTADLVLGPLTRPDTLSRDEARRLTKRLRDADAEVPMRLGRELLAALGPQASNSDVPRALRILELLDGLPGFQGTMIFLRQFAAHPDKRIRSKVALIMGRANRNAAWVRAALPGAGPRVRANLIESLWGLKTPEACQMYRDALEDEADRAAVNAAVGLVLAGDPGGLRALLHWLASPSPGRRRSAAWGAGQSGDPRLYPDVARTAKDEDPGVRRQAVQSLSKLPSPLDQPQVEVCIAAVRADLQGVTVEVAVYSSSGPTLSGLGAQAFLVRGKHTALVPDRMVETHSQQESSGALLIPLADPSVELIVQALHAERDRSPAARCLTQRYRADGVAPELDFSLAMLPGGSGGPSTPVTQAAQSGANTPSFSDAWRNALLTLSRAGGVRNVVLVTTSATPVALSTEQAELLRLERIRLSVLAVGCQPAPTLIQAAHGSGGSAYAVPDVSQVVAHPQRLITLLAGGSYRLTFLAPQYTGPANLQVWTGTALGQDCLTLPLWQPLEAKS